MRHSFFRREKMSIWLGLVVVLARLGLNSHHMMIFVRRPTIRSTFFHFTNEQQPWHVLSFAENYVGSNVTHPHIIGIIIIIMFLANICRSHLFSPFLLLFSPILLLFAFHQRAQGENRPRLSSPLQIDFSTHTTFLLLSLVLFFTRNVVSDSQILSFFSQRYGPARSIPRKVATIEVEKWRRME